MLLVSGCIAQYPQTIFEPHSDYADDLWGLLQKILIPAAIVFVLVEGALVYALIKFRQRPEHGRPQQVHGHTVLEIGWTIAPAVVLAFIAVPTVETIFKTQAPAPESALHVHVIGHQFWWEFQYPDLGVTTANEVWVPVNQTVNLQETSADVIHSFWIPAMGGKRDVVPNHVNNIWFTPSGTGTFLGQCSEFCGASHANMRARLMSVSPEDFQKWVQDQKTPVGQPPDNAPDTVKHGATLVAPCAGCHTIEGNPLNGNQKVGPNLSHVGSRTTFAAGVFELNKDNLHHWVQNAPSMKPGIKMPAFPNINDADADAIADYLLSLK